MDVILQPLNLLRRAFVLLMVIGCAQGWHELDNKEFHCWPLMAPREGNYLKPDCRGFGMHFITEPPSEVRSGDTFIVNFTFTATDEFFNWAVKNDTTYAEEYGAVFKGYGYRYYYYIFRAALGPWSSSDVIETAHDLCYRRGVFFPCAK